MDRYLSVHTYPRSTDPASGQNLSVTVIDGNTIQVNVGVLQVEVMWLHYKWN